MYKQDLALYKHKGFRCHKTQLTNQPTPCEIVPLVFHRILRDSKPPQKFRTFPSIQAVFNSLVIQIASVFPLISSHQASFTSSWRSFLSHFRVGQFFLVVM